MPFNVDPGVQQAPKFKIDPIKPDTSAAVLAEGIGNVLDTAVGAVDESIKADISNTIRKEYTLDNTIFGVDGAATMESNTKVAEKMGTDTPEGIRTAAQQLQMAKEAVQQGRLRESNYQSRLVAVMRQLRAQYPGYVDDIDQIATRITGQNPEHAARRALMSEWESDAKVGQKDAEAKRKNIEQWGENGWLPPNWENMDYQTLQRDVFKRRAMDADISRQKSNLELKTSQGVAAKQDAMDLASQFVSNTKALQFNDTLQRMGIGSWDDMFKKVQEYKADGVISPEEQQQITQVFDQLQQSSNAAFNAFIQQPLSNEPGAKSLEAVIQDSGKIEDLRKMAQRELDQMKDNFLNGNLGLLSINKTMYDNLMEGNSLQMGKDNPALLLLNGLSKLGGQPAVESYIKMHPEVLTKLDTKSRGALFQGQLNSVVSGASAKDTLKALDGEKGVDPSVKGAYLKSLVTILKDPQASPQMVQKITTSLFGSGNLDFMTSAALNDKDKEIAFRYLTSPEMTQFMNKNKGIDPQGWSNYKRWVAVSSQTLYSQAANTLQSYIVDPNTSFSVNFDGGKFVINGPSSVPGKDGSYEYPVSPPGDLVSAVEKINIGITNATEVAKANGEQPDQVYKAFTNGLRMDLTAKKNPTLWDTIRMQMQNLWKDDSSTSKDNTKKLGFNDAAGALAKMATPVANAIQLASNSSGFDVNDLAAMAYIESSGRPGPESDTGSYKGLFQLSQREFDKYAPEGSDIYDPQANAMAAAAKMKAESTRFFAKTGREAEAFDVYMIHQQGEGGYSRHVAHPYLPAWENMYATGEGQQKGEAWAKKAIWGNIPSDVKDQFPGGVETVTSEAFMQIWRDKFNRFRGDQADISKKSSEGQGIMGLNLQDLVGKDLSLTAIPQPGEGVRPPSKPLLDRMLKNGGRESKNIEDIRGLKETPESLDEIILKHQDRLPRK